MTQKIEMKQYLITKSFVFIVFFLYAAMIILLFIWALLNSFGSFKDILNNRIFPSEFSFHNYVRAFEVFRTPNATYVDMIINSIWLTFGRSGVGVFFQFLMGYALGRYKFTGKKAFIIIFVVTLMVPVYGVDAAKLKMIKNVGFYDSPAFIFLSIGCHSSMTLIVMTYFQGLSSFYSEAAEIDGANKFDIMFKIYFPMAMPMILSVLIITMLAAWNDYNSQIYYLPHYPNLSTGLYLCGEEITHSMDIPVYYSAIIMCAFPPFLLFIFARDKIMTSLTYGGVKE